MGGSTEILEATESIEIDDRGIAVCLVSGGMDSCVTAAIADRDNDSLAFLHASYGQLTEQRERRSFEEIARRSATDGGVQTHDRRDRTGCTCDRARHIGFAQHV